MDPKQFSRRSWTLVLLLAILLFGQGAALYDAQVVNGAYWLERSQVKAVETETISPDRGSILDRYGRVLVSNRVTYQVTLDPSAMGEERNQTVLILLDICREAGVEWTDTLTISTLAPYTFTREPPFYAVSTEEQDGETVTTRTLTYLGRLGVKLGWLPGDPTADKLHKQGWRMLTVQELMERMYDTFGIDLEAEGMSQTRARALAGVLYELYLRSYEVNQTTYVFTRDVDIDFISRVKELKLKGVNIEAVPVRDYGTDYAAHLLGQVGLMSPEEWNYYRDLDQGYRMSDYVGKDGVELAFESYLRGTPGRREINRNTDGKIIEERWISEPEPGGNVVLTIDIDLQQAVEEILASGVAELPSEEVEGAACVVLDVNSAEVLAAANYPTYNPSTYFQDFSENAANPLRPFNNRAFSGLYAPGSTFKMVTAIAGLEMGVIEPWTEIQDTGRYTYYNDNGPMCWLYRQYGSTHGYENVSEALRDSCNVFFYDVGRQVTIQGLQEYASYFGLGEPTGIELPESTGTMAGPKTEEEAQKWKAGSTLSVAIGQENSQFTPLQLANYVATLVNGGTHYAAHILKEIKSNDFSQVVFTQQPEVLNTVEIDPENLNAVLEGMRLLVTEGSVRSYFQNLKVTAGAKTGSAQVDLDAQSNAIFVCFAPFDNPQVAVALAVEHGGGGSEIAGIAADVLDYYFSAEETREEILTENALIR